MTNSQNYYTDLDDFPLLNWMKCNDGDLSFVRREGMEDEGKDDEYWFRLFDQYIQKYGLTELYQKMLKAMKKKALLELEFIQTGERFKLTEIAIEEENLRMMTINNGEGMSIEDSLIHLSKWMGFHLDARKIKVTEYFNLLKQYGKANQKK